MDSRNTNVVRFKSIGKDCQISLHASFYNPHLIEIGDNVRIDDFCILSAGMGGIKIGDNVHIGAYSSLSGAAEIQLDSYSGVGVRCTIHSSSDDFSGNFLVGPQIQKEYTNVKSEKVWLKKYAILGAHCVVLPGVTLDEGCAVGAMSLIRKSLPSYQIWAGNPVRFIRQRETRMTRFVERPEERETTRTKTMALEGIDYIINYTDPWFTNGGGRT